jgi:hypothetical protein
MRRIKLEERTKLADVALFHLFTDILALAPSPMLVDAICVAIDVALRQEEADGLPERINVAFGLQVKTPALAKALCDIVAFGWEYVSQNLFAALSHVTYTAEFQKLVTSQGVSFLDLCKFDDVGIVRRAALELHAHPPLAAYSSHPNPQPCSYFDPYYLFFTHHFSFVARNHEISYLGFADSDPIQSVVFVPSLHRV